MIAILLLTFLFAVPKSSASQTITNQNHSTLYTIDKNGDVRNGASVFLGDIKSDGTIQDKSYNAVGFLKGDWVVQDKSHNTIGYVSADYVRDANLNILGKISDDGTIRDRNDNLIGYSKNVPRPWTAALMFFLKL